MINIMLAKPRPYPMWGKDATRRNDVRLQDRSRELEEAEHNGAS